METLDLLWGRLIFSAGCWQTTVDAAWLGRVLLQIEGTLEQPPSSTQRVALQKLLELHPSLQTPLERAVFAYYTEMLGTYREALGQYADELAPKIGHHKQVRPLLSQPSLYIPLQEGPCLFEYRFETQWDLEHGLSVQVCQGPVLAVDTQSGSSWEYRRRYSAQGQRL